MVRRKGERPIVKAVRPYAYDHPVAQSIRHGSRWFDAWVAQMGTPYAVLTKKAKIPQERLFELSQGAAPTREEIEALAPLWFVTPEDLAISAQIQF